MVIHSNAIINEGLDRIVDFIADYEDRHLWDSNYSAGGVIKSLGEDSELHYIKTKRVAMVSPRDQYLVINRRNIEPEESPTGNRIVIIGARSKDFE